MQLVVPVHTYLVQYIQQVEQGVTLCEWHWYAWVAVGVLWWHAGHTKGSRTVSCLSDQKGLNAFQSNDTEVNVSELMSSWQCCSFSYCPCLNDSGWHATSVLQLPKLLQLG